MTDLRPGDILWRVGRGISELGIEQFGRYEVADFNAAAQLPLQLVDIPGLWSPRGWVLLSRRPTH